MEGLMMIYHGQTSKITLNTSNKQKDGQKLKYLKWFFQQYLRTLPKTSPAGLKMNLCLELGKFRIHPISWIQKFFWGRFDCLDVPLEAT